MANKVDMDSIVSKPLNTKERSSLMHVIGHTCITTEFGVNYHKAAYVNGQSHHFGLAGAKPADVDTHFG